MCTAVFIPAGDKYYFASLRDESPLRPAALVPGTRLMNGAMVLSPMDAKEGGTWIGITAKGSIIILLNGGFENHFRKAPYKKSRGLIVNDLLTSASPVMEWNAMDLEDIEPFTLVIWTENNLQQLVWDGKGKHCLQLATSEPYIWSSSTLYGQQAKVYRKQLFQNWMRLNFSVSATTVLNFFQSYADDQDGFLMNRSEKIKTLSYSFVALHPGQSASMEYHDFSNGTVNKNKIQFNAIEDMAASAVQLFKI